MSFLLNKAFLISIIAISAIVSLGTKHNKEIPEKMNTPPAVLSAPTVNITQPKVIATPSPTPTAPQPRNTPTEQPKIAAEKSIVPVQNTPVNAKATAPEPTYYPVTKVVDGDTLTIEMNGKSQTLRLIGLDTPETVDPRKPVQCFGVEASNKAKSILTGQMVRIETDPSQDTYDKYNRLLVYVYLKDGTLFNKMMVQEGYGHEYTYNTPYKYQREFKTAENEARTQKRGLWADGACGEPNITPIPTEVAPTPATAPPTSTSGYVCTADIYNCASFKTHAEAQSTYEACGGASHDVHRLDADKDGQACESLP